MPQSLSRILIHTVFSTKDRLPFLRDPQFRGETHAYLAGCAKVARYVDHQEEHHRKNTFQDEYRELLRLHGQSWDERYVWD